MGKKWYSYFVVTDEARDAPVDPSAPVPSSGRRAVEIAPEPEVVFDPPTVTPTDLGEVYEAAKIQSPAHGYTVLKVAEMLESEHLQALPPEIKRKSVLVALEAAGVKVDEVVQDAVRRDRALDTYERVLETHLGDLRARTARENEAIEQEIAQQVSALRARVDANREKLAQEERQFEAWRAGKQREEAAIAAAVGYFVTENPITTLAGPDAGTGGTDVR